MSEAGCIAPYIPRNMSKDYPICETLETGTLAWDIYNKYVYNAQFSKNSEVYEDSEPFSVYLTVCSVAEAMQCDDSVAGPGKCEREGLPLQSDHQTYHGQH